MKKDPLHRPNVSTCQLGRRDFLIAATTGLALTTAPLLVPHG